MLVHDLQRSWQIPQLLRPERRIPRISQECRSTACTLGGVGRSAGIEFPVILRSTAETNAVGLSGFASSQRVEKFVLRYLLGRPQFLELLHRWRVPASFRLRR